MRTGDARQVRDILHHNLLDLLTKAQLVAAALTGCDPEEAAGVKNYQRAGKERGGDHGWSVVAAEG